MMEGLVPLGFTRVVGLLGPNKVPKWLVLVLLVVQNKEGLYH